jgi:hypothetical protein
VRRSDYSVIPSVAKDILSIEGVMTVRYSALTGSILLTHKTGSNADPIEEIRSSGVLNIVDLEPDLGEDTTGDIRDSLRMLDSRISELSGNEIDLQSLAALTLGCLALLQFSRGQGLPAGLTMMIHAGRIIKGRM